MENYVMTDVGLIPQSWKIEKLGDLGFFKNGINKDKDDFGFGYPMVNLNHVFSNFSINNSMSFDLVNANENERKNYALKKGDILFIRSSVKPEGVGLTSVVDYDLEDTTYSGFIIRFRLHKDYLVHKFKHYVFYENRFRHRLICKSSVSANTNINQGALHSLKIPIPPKEEQKAIADCLSTWDEAIEKQTKLIAAKEQRKKALMQQLLSGKKRLPGFENTEVCYDKYSNLLSNVKRKEKWDDNKLYQLISVRRRSGGVFAREELFGNQIAVKELMKVKENDFLISKMQIVHGASAIVPKHFENFYVSGSYIVLNVKDENRLRPLFLKWYSTLRSFYHQTFIASYGVHIEKMTFSFQDFLKEKMRLPNVKEQDLIIEILEQSEKEVKLEKTRLLLLLNQKKAIMQQLLIGKVRLVS